MNGRMARRRNSKIDNDPPDHQVTLTARQEQVLGTALEHGYFEFPRRTSLTGLSKLVGVRPSTLSEILRGAERRVMESAVRVHNQDQRRVKNSA